MELEHFSHEHPLMLMENDGEKKVINVCSGCEESVLEYPYYYQCSSHCNFALHKSCAQLPREMQHLLHPKHPLILKAQRPGYYCDACQKRTGNCFSYCCELCNFDLDIKCASHWQININDWQISIDDCQQHAFITIFEQIQFTCKACGEEGEGKDIPYLCSNCRFLIHYRCAIFPRTVEIRRHNHSLTLTYSLHEQVKESNKLLCKLCYKRVNTKYGAYYCQKCNYAAHLKCGLASAEFGIGIHKTNLEVKSVVQTYKGDREINHFSHEHKLMLITDTEEELKDNQYCAGCKRQISAPFYCCAPCNFFIHLRCAQLPSQMQHPFHAHELTLRPYANFIYGMFKCVFCGQLCNGFTYNCGTCGEFTSDVQCCSTPETLTHEGHKHPLFLAQKVYSDNEKCSACDDSNDLGRFVCTDCNFTLGYRCATLPLVVRHIDHCRLLTLTLTYEVEDDSGEYYCLICEEERDPKHWFNYSVDCGFAAHPQCVLGKYPYIKFGDT